MACAVPVLGLGVMASDTAWARRAGQAVVGDPESHSGHGQVFSIDCRHHDDAAVDRVLVNRTQSDGRQQNRDDLENVMNFIEFQPLRSAPFSVTDRAINRRLIRAKAAGLDQQGRYEIRPLPAEACTEIGADVIGEHTAAFIWVAIAALGLVAGAATASVIL